MKAGRDLGFTIENSFEYTYTYYIHSLKWKKKINVAIFFLITTSASAAAAVIDNKPRDCTASAIRSESAFLLQRYTSESASNIERCCSVCAHIYRYEITCWEIGTGWLGFAVLQHSPGVRDRSPTPRVLFVWGGGGGGFSCVGARVDSKILEFLLWLGNCIYTKHPRVYGWWLSVRSFLKLPASHAV